MWKNMNDEAEGIFDDLFVLKHYQVFNVNGNGSIAMHIVNGCHAFTII